MYRFVCRNADFGCAVPMRLLVLEVPMVLPPASSVMVKDRPDLPDVRDVKDLVDAPVPANPDTGRASNPRVAPVSSCPVLPSSSSPRRLAACC